MLQTIVRSRHKHFPIVMWPVPASSKASLRRRKAQSKNCRHPQSHVQGIGQVEALHAKPIVGVSVCKEGREEWFLDWMIVRRLDGWYSIISFETSQTTLLNFKAGDYEARAPFTIEHLECKLPGTIDTRFGSMVQKKLKSWSRCSVPHMRSSSAWSQDPVPFAVPIPMATSLLPNAPPFSHQIPSQ